MSRAHPPSSHGWREDNGSHEGGFALKLQSYVTQHEIFLAFGGWGEDNRTARFPEWIL